MVIDIQRCPMQMREASCLPILVLLVLAQLVPSSSQPLDGATLIDPDQARCAWADVAWDQCCRTASASCRMFVLCSWHQQCPGSLLAAVPPNLLMVVAIGIGGLLCFARWVAASDMHRAYDAGSLPHHHVFYRSVVWPHPSCYHHPCRLASVRTMSLPQFMSTISRPFAPYTAVATGLTQPPNNSSTDSTLDKGAHAVPSSMSDLLAQHATSGYACIHAQPWDLCLPDLALCLFFWCCYTLCVVQWTFEGAAYPSWAVAAAVVGIVVSYCLVRPVWAACCCCPCVADDDCRPGTSPVRTARTPGARMGAALGKSRLVTPDQAVRLIEGWKQAPVKLVSACVGRAGQTCHHGGYCWRYMPAYLFPS